MKRVLVLALLCAFGIGAATFAGPISGMWDTDINFHIVAADGSIHVNWFTSRLDVNYSVGGWIFGSTVLFDLAGMNNLYFDASGTLGAFSFTSLLDFNPTIPEFVQWDNVALVSIAGVNIYALFSLENIDPGNGIGVGYTVGGWGSAGDAKFYGEVRFNLANTLGTIYWYGFDYLLKNNEIYYSSSCTNVKGYFIDVVQSQCTAAFSGVSLAVAFPFACLNPQVFLEFDCITGFKNVTLEFDDVCLGLDWLKLAELDISFTVQTKSVSWWFKTILGDCVCLTPYVSVVYKTDGGSSEITGIELNALLLKYTWNGVTFTAGEIFGDATWPMGTYGEYLWGFTKAGVLKSTYYDCQLVKVSGNYADEFFGVTVTGDSCCGGSFSAGVFNFFDAGGSGSGIFDWILTVITLDYGIASNLSVNMGLEVAQGAGFNSLTVGFKLTW